jgi:hypothetical protein
MVSDTGIRSRTLVDSACTITSAVPKCQDVFFQMVNEVGEERWTGRSGYNCRGFFELLKDTAIYKGNFALFTFDNSVAEDWEIISFVVHRALTSPAEA